MGQKTKKYFCKIVIQKILFVKNKFVEKTNDKQILCPFLEITQHRGICDITWVNEATDKQHIAGRLRYSDFVFQDQNTNACSKKIILGDDAGTTSALKSTNEKTIF